MALDLRSGINGAALCGSTELPTISWSFNPIAKTVDFENSLSGGYDLTAATFKAGTGTIVFDVNFLAPAFGAPINLYPGMTLTNVHLYSDKTQLSGWNCPSVVVTSTPTSVQISGKIGQSFSFKTNGAYAVGS